MPCNGVYGFLRLRTLGFDVQVGYCTLDAAALETAWKEFVEPKPKKRKR